MKNTVFYAILMFCITLSAQSTKLKVADSLFSYGNYSKAIKVYKEVSNNTKVNNKIAKAYEALGNYNLALEYYKTSIASNPDNIVVLYSYAKLLWRTKKYEEASELFEKLIYKDYQNPNFHYYKGLVLEKLKDSTALNRFKSTYDLDNTHQKAIFKIARYYLVKRHHKLSHRYIDKGLESYPQNKDLISLKAQNYYHQKNYTKAIVWFNKLIDIGEASEFVHEKLSLSYANNSDYKNAIFHRKKVLEYNTKDATSMAVISSYYERLSDFKNAEDYMAMALKIKDIPLNREYVALAKAQSRQKKYEQAIATYQKAIKEKPEDVFTRFLLLRTKDEYYADKEHVIKLYEKFIERYKSNSTSKFAQMRLTQLKEEMFLKQD